MNKKGVWGFEEIAKILLILVGLVIFILIILALKGRLSDVIDKIATALRFR